MSKLKVSLEAITNYVGHALLESNEVQALELWRCAELKDHTHYACPWVTAKITLSAQKYRQIKSSGLIEASMFKAHIVEALKGHCDIRISIDFFPILDDDDSWRNNTQAVVIPNS